MTDKDEAYHRTKDALDRRRRLQEFADFQDEQAGRDTGKMKKYYTKENAPGRAGERADRVATQFALMQMRMSDPLYRQTWERFQRKLDLMDEASRRARRELERELEENRRQHDRLLDNACRDEQGRRVFMTEDERAAYYEDGTKLSEEQFGKLPKDALSKALRWEEKLRNDAEFESLQRERQDLDRYDQERARLRDVKPGELSQEELEDVERSLESRAPNRVRRQYDQLSATEPAQKQENSFRLSSDEFAALDGPAASSGERGQAAMAKSDLAGAPPVNAHFAAVRTGSAIGDGSRKFDPAPGASTPAPGHG